MRSRRNRGFSQVWILIVCVLIGAVVTYLQYDRLTKTRAELADVEQQIKSTQATIDIEKEVKKDNQVRVMPATKEEEAEFVEHFRAMAAARDVSVVRWASSGVVALAPPPAPAANATAEQAPPPITMTPLAVSVDLVGNYTNVRQFMDELQKSKRLIFIENATFDRKDEGKNTRLQCRIIRFVDPAMTVAEPAVTGQTPVDLGGTN